MDPELARLKASGLEPKAEAAGQAPEAYHRSWDAGWSGRAQTASARGPQAYPGLLLPPARRVMPRRIRLVLLFFLILGGGALVFDSVLLVVSVAQHQHKVQNQGSIQRASSFLRSDRSQPTSGPEELFSTPSGTISVRSGSASPISSHASSIVGTGISPLNDDFWLSSSSLSFVTTQDQSDPPPQRVKLSSNVDGGFNWQVVSLLPSWLYLSSIQGSATTGTRAELIVSVFTSRLAPATYTATVLVRASDSHQNPLPGSPQTLNVTLRVLTPCSVNVTPTTLSFHVNLLSPIASAQTLTLTESGNCTWPVTWQIGSNDSWLIFPSTSGFASTSGSTITVQANNSNKLLGTFTTHFILQVSDSQGTALSGSPVSITATLTVLG